MEGGFSVFKRTLQLIVVLAYDGLRESDGEMGRKLRVQKSAAWTP